MILKDIILKNILLKREILINCIQKNKTKIIFFYKKLKY